MKKAEMAITIDRLMAENRQHMIVELEMADEIGGLTDRLAFKQTEIDNQKEQIVMLKRSFGVGDDR